MAECQELNVKKQIGKSSNHPASEKFCGTGRIVCVEDDFGIIRTPDKQMILFREKNYIPSTKGILQDLKRSDVLCFEAKQNTGHKRIKWTAISIWKPGYEPACQIKPKLSKPDNIKQDTEAGALIFLRSILESALSLNLKDLPSLCSNKSRNVKRIFLDEQKTLTFLMRHRSVFHMSDADKTVKLVNESVRETIRYVAGVLVESGWMELGCVRSLVAENSNEAIASYGKKSKQLKSFLRQFSDVFNLRKDGEQWFVALQPNFLCDLDDNESLASVTSHTTFDSTSFPSLSTSSSMLSVSAGPSLHASMSDLAVSESAKNRGISKLLNVLLKKEPLPVKNLIGYIHTSPSEVRLAIGNTMEKLTNFLQKDDNFFLQKPENLVYIRSTVEKRALKYLSELASKEREVKLDDILKFQGKHVSREVKAFLGRNVSEVSSAVNKLIAKEELMSECCLVLKDDLISIGYSSQSVTTSRNLQQVNEDKNRPASSSVDHNKDFLLQEETSSSECKKHVSDVEKSENQAVDFLRNVLEQHEVLCILSINAYLCQASTEICQILADTDLINAFLKRHPSVFKISGLFNLIELVDDDVRDAIAFCLKILNLKGDLKFCSLAGHMSSASPRIRRVIGGPITKLEAFLQQYFDVFRVYEGKEGLMASSKLRKCSSSRPSITVSEASAVGGASVSTAGLLFSESVKTEVSTEKYNGMNRCFEAVIESPDEPNVNHTQQEPDSKVNGATSSAGLEFLTGLLKMHSALLLKDVVQHVSQASRDIQEELGHSEEDILSLVEENPAIFKISGREFRIELIDEACSDAIEFFLDVLNKRGLTPVSKIHGHLSQASPTIRKTTGGSSESVKAFLLQFPNVFTVYNTNGVEVVASLYEGECGSESSETSDNKKPEAIVSSVTTEPKNPAEGSETTSVSVSAIDGPNFDYALNLSEKSFRAAEASPASTLAELDFDLIPIICEKSSKAHETSSMVECDKLDELDVDYILSMSETSKFRSVETRVDFIDRKKSVISEPVSTKCEDIVADPKPPNLATAEKASNVAVRVDTSTETHPGSTISSLQVSSYFLKQAGLPSDNSVNPPVADVNSLPSLVKCAKDESNVISDLCLQAVTNNNGHALDIAELLKICQKADPLGNGWKNTLCLENLGQIIKEDDRFCFNMASGSVMLIRDVEYMAAAFLRRCILYYGSMVLEKLCCYNYLLYASAEVQALLGTSGNSTVFRKKSIKLLWPKFRDQLLVQNGVLVVPQDEETDALGFLSNLIETYGPLQLKSLPDYLSQASSLVNQFLRKKLGDIEAYLQTCGLDKQFCVWNGVVDLVRSGNLLKNRLIVEQSVASFLINAMQLCGPIFWDRLNKQLDSRKATPEVCEFLGGQWNATSFKRSVLQKFCSDRPYLFFVGADGVQLLPGQGGTQSRSLKDCNEEVLEASSNCALSCTGTKPASTQQMAIQFLKDIITRHGAIGCKQKQLRSGLHLKDAPSDVRALLGGQVTAVSFEKKLLKKFCSHHPTVFITFNRSIDLNRIGSQTPPATVIDRNVQVPVTSMLTQNLQETSEQRNLATKGFRFQGSLGSAVITQLPTEPLSSTLLNALTPATSACSPATAATVFLNGSHLVASAVMSGSSVGASYPTVLCSGIKSSQDLVAAPPLPQTAYIPLNQLPLVQYPHETLPGLPLSLGQPPPVQHSWQPQDFETLPHMALYPYGAISPVLGSSSPVIQGSVAPCAPGMLVAQCTVPVVKPLGSMLASHALPLSTLSPSWMQPAVPVEPVASVSSTFMHAPFVDGIYSDQAEPPSFDTAVLLPPAQLLQNNQPVTSTSTQVKGSEPHVAEPFYSSLASAASSSTVKPGTLEAMVSEGETLEKSGESEKTKDLVVMGEPSKRKSLKDVEESSKTEGQEGLAESNVMFALEQLKDSEDKEGEILLEQPQMITTPEITKGSHETVTDGILTEKDAEAVKLRDDRSMSKSDGILKIDDTKVNTSSAVVANLSLNETEVAKADASLPGIESSMKSAELSSSSPVTWKSLADSAELPEFDDQFGQLFDGISRYHSFLDEEAQRQDLSVAAEYLSDVCDTDDLYETAESDIDEEGQDFEEVMGTVLSAIGNRVYVKKEGDQVVHFTSANCSEHFTQCCNLGRHFAHGECVVLRYKKCPYELVSAVSVLASATDNEALGACCSDHHINFGRGRVTLFGKNYVVFAMSNQEMTGFIPVNPHIFSPNDLVDVWSTKVSGFMTPWRVNSIVFTNQHGLTFAAKRDPRWQVDKVTDSSPWKLTTDVSCQTDPPCDAVPMSVENRPVSVVCHQNTQTSSTDNAVSLGWYPGE